MGGPGLEELALGLEARSCSARELVEGCLARIDDREGEGSRAFVSVDREAAIVAADCMDRLRAAGAHPSRFAGIPVSVKDLFDIRGQVTRAGSVVLDGPPASEDAPSVARLRAHGFILIGRSTMTEFAYSGLGLNPHYGSPLSPWGRATGHISGGSTSGGAVSVADGMAHAALGTDTGGSCRIPAAWCGLAGFKPTARRVPLDGAIPLSGTLDSIGPIGRTAQCCALLDAILAGGSPGEIEPRDLRGLRIGAVQNVVLGDIEDAVAEAYEAALRRLERAGAVIERISVTAFDKVAPLSAKGGFPAAEAYGWHRELLAARGDEYDPRVSVRILRGREQDAADFVQLRAGRDALVAEAAAQIANFDAIAMPTTPILPPTLASMQDDAAYGRANILALRNPTLINMMDGCAISLPANRPGEPPVGLMLASVANNDRNLLAISMAVETVLRA